MYDYSEKKKSGTVSSDSLAISEVGKLKLESKPQVEGTSNLGGNQPNKVVEVIKIATSGNNNSQGRRMKKRGNFMFQI